MVKNSSQLFSIFGFKSDVLHPYQNLVEDFLRSHGVGMNPPADINLDDEWSEECIYWKNDLLPSFYRMFDLAVGRAVLLGIRLAFSSMERPDNLTSIDPVRLLDLSQVTALDEYQRLDRCYQDCKTELLQSMPETQRRCMESLIARQEAIQFQIWHTQMAGHIFYTYLATVYAMTTLESKRENVAFTQQLLEALGDYLI